MFFFGAVSGLCQCFKMRQSCVGLGCNDSLSKEKMWGCYKMMRRSALAIFRGSNNSLGIQLSANEAYAFWGIVVGADKT
jgi:hypothetical protein